MKKIGILTIPRADNYGSVLQSYALLKHLNNLGYSVELIDYVSPFLVGRYNLIKINKINVKTKIISLIQHMIDFPAGYKKKRKFIAFRNNFFKFSSEKIVTPEQFDKYDAIIIGSDQIWNKYITNADLNFFLPNINANKKIAYAPSIGFEIKENEDIQFYKENLSKFKFISLREKSSAIILQELLGRPIPVVLDPTLLLSRQDWKLFLNEKKEKNYILVYMFGDDKRVIDTVTQLHNKTQLPVKIIGGTIRKYSYDNYLNQVAVGPVDFLKLISDAKFVVTNSFHGVALSVALNTNFTAVPYEGTESRVVDLLSSIGLINRLYDENENDFSDIDFDEVNQKVDMLRKKSDEYLQNSLKTIDL